MNNPPKTLDDMIRTEDYMVYEAESTMSLQYRIINVPASVVYKVTHQDIINTWVNYLDDILSAYITEDEWDNIHTEITVIENYHNDVETIDDVVHDLSEYIEYINDEEVN